MTSSKTPRIKDTIFFTGSKMTSSIDLRVSRILKKDHIIYNKKKRKRETLKL